MAYLVSLAARAERDLVFLYEDIHAAESASARRWYRGLKRAILSLAQQPNRCPATVENRKLRHLLYGHPPHVYRIIYRVTERIKRVEVLHVRHGARRNFRRSDLR